MKKIALIITAFICFNTILIIAPNLSTTKISYFKIIAIVVSMLILHWALYRYAEKSFVLASGFSKIKRGIFFVMCMGYLYLFVALFLPFIADKNMHITPKYNVYIALFMIMASSFSDLKNRDRLEVSTNDDLSESDSS